MYLDSQFPGGRKNQCPGFTLLVSRQRFPGQQPLAAGKQKRDGLAGSGLGLPRHVRAVQGMRQRLRLDRCTVFEPGFCQSSKQAIIQ